MGHLTKTEQKHEGAHYTPSILADFVAEQIIQSWKPNGYRDVVHIIDPAAGDGELLFSLTQKILSQDFPDIKLTAFDTDNIALELAKTRFCKIKAPLSTDWINDDFLNYVLERDDLFAPKRLNIQFDLVISNPPYVRTQVLGAKKAKALSRQFGLSGRLDLYQAFVLAISQVLKPSGVAGIIISNKFLTNKTGAAIRQEILRRFDILHIWDLGDTKLFKAAVLPSVIIVKQKNEMQERNVPTFTSIYSAPEPEGEIRHVDNIIEALTCEGIVQVASGELFHVRQGVLDFGKRKGEVWKLSNAKVQNWLNRVKQHTFCHFADINKIRVGVKTTADKVFIRSDWDTFPINEKPELLFPLTTHHIARKYRAKETTIRKMIVYPYQTGNGKRIPIKLENYPKTAKYLEKHRNVLESRKYVIESGRKWFEIWVPHTPNEWQKPKLIFRDITQEPMFWLDFSGSIVNGDCYWLSCHSSNNLDLLWLALAVSNSSFIEKFYDYSFNNKLYAGRRRFITQYVERFPLPDPSSECGTSIISLVKDIYEHIDLVDTTENQSTLHELIWKAFGFSNEEISR